MRRENLPENAMSDLRKTLSPSLARVGIFAAALEFPKNSDRPVMGAARRFADRLVGCVSSDDVSDAVGSDHEGAVALCELCFHWMGHDEIVAWDWACPPEVPNPDITACGHFAIDLLNAIEAAYPEGLTDNPG